MTQTKLRGEMKRRKLSLSPWGLTLLIVVTLAAGIYLGVNRQQVYGIIAPLFGVTISSDTIDTELLQEAYQALQVNYDGPLDDQTLSEGAARGLVEAAGDDYTAFFDAEEADEFNDDMSGSIGGGVGAQIGLRDDVVTLMKILPDTPAERSGLKAGDRVLSVNDESTEGYSVEQAVAKIRGDINTTVKLEIERGSSKRTISVTREEISAPSVMSETKGDIGIMTVVRFDNNTARLARRAADQFQQAKVSGVILDLRGNPGGYLDAAQGLASVWLDDKVIVVEKKGDKLVETLRSAKGPQLGRLPTVVLIDGNSASASEIVAGALKDHQAATLMGETTFGKGSVQRLVPLADGTMLKVTVARWYTPSGKNISKEGIKPDKAVKLDEKALLKDSDSQLDAALEYLR